MYKLPIKCSNNNFHKSISIHISYTDPCSTWTRYCSLPYLMLRIRKKKCLITITTTKATYTQWLKPCRLQFCDLLKILIGIEPVQLKLTHVPKSRVVIARAGCVLSCITDATYRGLVASAKLCTNPCSRPPTGTQN